MQGLQSAQAAYDPYYNQARSDISSGYGGAINTYTPGYNLGQSGAQAYADITGANGPEGQDRARALFQASPGFQFSVDTANQEIERALGKYGLGTSGNLATAIGNRDVQLANQDFGNYVSRLAPFLGYSLGTAGQLGGAQTQQGALLGSTALQGGQQAYGTQAGIGSAQAAGTLGAAQARTQAAGNIANLATKLLGYAAAPLTGGASTLLSSMPQFWGGAVGNVSDYPSNIDEMIMRG